jgi:hypothetical protein
LSLLDKRKDSEAVHFYKANSQFNKFRDDFGLEEFENVIGMYSVFTNDLTFGKLYICSERLCYVASLNKKKKFSIQYKNISEIKVKKLIDSNKENQHFQRKRNLRQKEGWVGI